MKRIFLSLILFLTTFCSSVQPIDQYEHNAFVQGYVQSMQCEQVKLSNGKLELYHRRSFLLAALLGTCTLMGAATAGVPLLLLDDQPEVFFIKIFCGVTGGVTMALSIYKLLQMYSSTPLVVLSSEGFHVPGRSLIAWDDIAEVAITESVEKISSGNTFNNNGFITASVGSEQKIVTYGVLVKNKYGQTMYHETEKVLPVEASSLYTLLNHYRVVFHRNVQ